MKAQKKKKKGAAEMKWLKTNQIYTFNKQQHNNNKHKYGHVYGRGLFQLFPFFSDVCSGWARLAP